MVGFLFMPVLAIFPLIGAYNQIKLSEDAWRIINAFMSRHQSKTGGPQQPHGWAYQNAQSSLQKCPACGSSLSPQAAFCSSCGAQTSPMPVCKKCNTTNQLGARFCSGCGERFGGE